MDKFDFHPSSLTNLRRASIEDPTTSLRRLSLTTTKISKKTVTFSLPASAITDKSLSYNLHTAYLFTSKDIKTILVPQTIFGLINAYAATRDASAVLSRTPLILAWIFLNLLPFCIGNQRQPGSVAEDSINRPSRPLPANRLTAEEAYIWMIVLYASALVFSLCAGGTSMWLALIVLGWLYNDCQMSETGIISRNVLTALGYAAFGVGALIVAMPPTASSFSAGLSTKTWIWIALLAIVIGTTGQMTDMADLEGDRQRGRNTAPIVWGEQIAKWTICIPVAVASVLCPWFWHASFLGHVVPVMIGGRIVARLLTEDVKAHKTTNRIWNGWVAVLYTLPLFAI